MSFIGSVIEKSAMGALRFGAGVGKMAWSGGLAGRTLLGATAGGIAGYASSDAYSFGTRLEEGARGAVLGGAIGAAASTGIGALGLRHRLGGRTLWSAMKPYPRGFIGPRMKSVWSGNFTVGEAIMGLRPSMPNPVRLAKSVASTVKGTAKAGIQIGAWAVAHPKTALATVGAGAYAYSSLTSPHYGSSPTLEGAAVQTDYDNQALAAAHMSAGIAPVGSIEAGGPGQRRFEQSTEGLVMGLHRGRHG